MRRGRQAQSEPDSAELLVDRLTDEDLEPSERTAAILEHTARVLAHTKGAGASALIGKLLDLSDRYQAEVRAEEASPATVDTPRDACRKLLEPERVRRWLTILGVPRDRRDHIVAELRAGLRDAQTVQHGG